MDSDKNLLNFFCKAYPIFDSYKKRYEKADLKTATRDKTEEV
jgi:hypothetical protein